MYLKQEFSNRLIKNPELRRQLSVETGVHPETIKRCAIKNNKMVSSRLTTKPFLKFMSKRWDVKESELTCEEIFQEVIISDSGDEMESIKSAV